MVQIPVAVRNSSLLQIVNPISYSMGTGILFERWQSNRDMKLASDLHRALMLRKSISMPLIPPYAFKA